MDASAGVLGRPADDALAHPLFEGLGVDRAASPAAVVIFGASGDLTSRKLMPALQALASRGQLSPGTAIVGVGRTDLGDEGFRRQMRQAVEAAGGRRPGGKVDEQAWAQLEEGFRYVAGGYDDLATYKRLGEVLEDLDRDHGTAGNRLHYLSTPPGVFSAVVHQLGAAGLHHPARGGQFCRVVIEKPFGRDLDSARRLDHELHEVLEEDQIYRIDHYLGKETVQNVLALRFANTIFEPVWSRQYVDSVQITVAESEGVGHRAGFYEQAGALRDIVQNHLLQVLALTVMEPPASMSPTGIRNEKVKALDAVDVLEPHEVLSDTVRAQYGGGWLGGEDVPGYLEEDGVAPDSRTETYLAMRLRVDNWRWAGVPFYLRTGKRLPKRVTEVALEFSRVPHLPFAPTQAVQLGPNALVLRIQPDEGITLRFGAKVPGQAFDVRTVSMDFSYGAAFLEEAPEAYERLLLDALLGDPTLFIRTDEVEQAWRIAQPLLETWAEKPVLPVPYEAGTWGPVEADRLLEADGRRWRQP
ncbi:MAG: glucose-6-phosphate dehydrogenase [Actinobacteria bacterium]|nr:glucose-6-phosphate dehydrogenase [Actinomycetota bacterium]